MDAAITQLGDGIAHKTAIVIPGSTWQKHISIDILFIYIFQLNINQFNRMGSVILLYQPFINNIYFCPCIRMWHHAKGRSSRSRGYRGSSKVKGSLPEIKLMDSIIQVCTYDEFI